MPARNPVLYNLIYDAFVKKHGEQGARWRAEEWEKEFLNNPGKLSSLDSSLAGVKSSYEKLMQGDDNLYRLLRKNMYRSAAAEKSAGIRKLEASESPKFPLAGANNLIGLLVKEKNARDDAELRVADLQRKDRLEGIKGLTDLEQMRQKAIGDDNSYELSLYNLLKDLNRINNPAEKDKSDGTMSFLTSLLFRTIPYLF
ncbi:MAG: hypothetical protein L6Q59_14565 [Ignavibacteriaceae bacterium]|nr:hypothetical protein [Ignavibacteriaceae bacterium]